MATKHASVTVAVTATDLMAGVQDNFQMGPGLDYTRSITIQNPGAVAVFLGDSTVTSTSYGYSLAAGLAVTLNLGPGDTLHGAVATGTQVVRVLHTGV